MKKIIGIILTAAVSLQMLHFPVNAAAPAATAPISADDSFFVCVGTFGAEGIPLFRYFQRCSGYTDNYKQQMYCFAGLDTVPAYGDIYLAESDTLKTVTNSPDTLYIFRLDPETELRYAGNCLDFMEQKTLTATSILRNVMHGEAEYGELYADYTSASFCDTEEQVYRYRIDTYDSAVGQNLQDLLAGDTVTFAVFNGSAILQLSPPVHTPDKMGDADCDGLFRIDDVVLLQKWLLGDPAAQPADWTAADFNADDRLNAADLTLMKRAVWDEPPVTYCILTVTTEYGGSDYNGNPLKSGSFTESVPVLEGDVLYETLDGHWLKNEKNHAAYSGRIMTVTKIGTDGVTVQLAGGSGTDTEKQAVYDKALQVVSAFTVYEGINYTYSVLFSAAPAEP